MKKIYPVIFCFYLISFLKAQDIQISTLTFNPVVFKKWEQLKSMPAFRLPFQADTLSLPFFDDFSEETVYPDPSRWMDRSVYINRGFPIAPVNIGVATFEGLNWQGYPYNFTASPAASQSADTLTSKPVDLGSPMSPADSVYLSFYYQAKGRGDAPDNSTSPAGNDSLFLQFKKVSTGKWITVWKKPAYTLKSSDTNFHRVMVPVRDTAWFKKGFQFRFRNYASPTGNLDHWHIDYVKLEQGRTYTDTVDKGIEFVYNTGSFLKEYWSMPWNQYTPADMAQRTSVFIRNNDTAVAPVTYEYHIMDETMTKVYSYNGGNVNLDPYNKFGYDKDPNHITPPVSPAYQFPAGMSDSTVFTIRHVIVASNNDTLNAYQRFYNYFAYDDGTAELSVFLNNPFSQLAYKFTLNKSDTLRAVKMYFNPLLKSAVPLGFRIMIWRDGPSGPGTEYYRDSVMYPFYEKMHNGYVTYKISHPSLVMPAGNYYFGYMQLQAQTVENSMKLGLDLNTNSADKIYINVSGYWQVPNLKGSLMIRPVFGDTNVFAGIPNPLLADKRFIKLYPNPASDWIQIDAFRQDEKIKVFIYDMVGKIVYVSGFEAVRRIDVSSLTPGIYIIYISSPSGKTHYREKILISR